MSILERIRNKSGLAIIFVGGALALFVISDALQSNSRIFGGGSGTTIGEVDGVSIDYRELEAKTKENEEGFKQRQNLESVDPQTMEMIREQTWNQLIQDAILKQQYEELGIEVTNDELFDMIQGENPSTQIKTAPIFQSKETGQFDINLVKQFLKRLQESGDENAMAQWVAFEDGLTNETMVRKFNDLIKKGAYVTSLETKSKYNERARSADFDMVALNYFSIPDSAIAVDESELKSYFKKNSDKYAEPDNGRKMEFVVFDVQPSAEDSASIKKWVADQMSQFAEAKNDTLYVDVNSESKFDTLAHPMSDYPDEVADALFASPIGQVVGPVFKDGKYRIYKVSGVKTDSMYNMRASHILFKTEGPTEQDTANTMKKANEVLAQLRKGADFAELAAQYGTDGTASRGGDLGWFREDRMVKEFSAYVKAHNKGDIGIVKTQFGIHIVKVTGDKSKKLVCSGVIERTVEPSEATTGVFYNKAVQFASAINEGDFDQIVAEQGLTKRLADNIRENDRQLAGYPEAREVVRWAYNAKVGAVSDVFSVGNIYMVAKLVGIREKGKADFDLAKERVTVDFIKDAKADQLMEKAKTAAEGSSDLQAIATKLQTTVAPVMAQTFENAGIPYVGQDNIFIGTVYGTTALNKLSGPVRGENAVYFYSVKKFNEPANLEDMENVKRDLLLQAGQRFENGSMEALKELGGLKDNRSKFY